MYTVLSKYYDIFMSDLNYGKWSDYICGFLKPMSCGVDIGCGTGKFTVDFIKKGYNVYGVDKNSKMLSAAADYAKKCGVRAGFVSGDISNFKFLKKVDFVTAVCDVINYLKDPLPAFKNVFLNLNTGGVFVFDISTEYKLTQILGNNTYSETRGDITYIWNNSLYQKAGKIDMELTFFEKTGELYKKSIERQTQYIHKEEKIRQQLLESGFSKILVYSHLTKKKLKNDDVRAQFIAYK